MTDLPEGPCYRSQFRLKAGVMPSRVAFLGVFLGLCILAGLVEAILLGFVFVETKTMSVATG